MSGAPSARLILRCSLAAAALLVTACHPPPPPQQGPSPDVPSLFATAALPASAERGAGWTDATQSPATPLPPQAPCRTDDDCGYDPRNHRCGTDPAFNKQPPLVDQGLVCYCEEAMSTCALLRVEPAPCEGESSCAVRADPRPHPVRATADLPYVKPRYCRPPRGTEQRRIDRFTTCERTNICTMHTRECARP